jgi:LacI family transcriptional regulator
MLSTKYNLKEKTQQHLLDYIEKAVPKYLPSERELMKTLKVSRATVRNALSAMVNDGIIVPVHGKGYLVLYGRTKGEKKNMVGLIVRRRYELFEQELFNELGNYLNKLNYKMVYMSLEPNEELFPSRLSAFLREVKVAIFSGGIIDSAPIYEVLKPHLEHCVILGNVCNSLYPVKYVNLDVDDGCYKITRHLLRLGHRNIAFAGLLKDELRLSGIKRAHEKSGLVFKDENCFEITKIDRYHGFKVAHQIFNKNKAFSAVICHNDLVALGFTEYCLMHGINIPGQISICGFDDIEDSRHFPIPLTTVQANRTSMVKRTMELIGEPLNSITATSVIKVKLQIRESTKKL